MLEGTGLLPGGETGFRKGAKTSLNEAREGQGADVSKADEDTRHVQYSIWVVCSAKEINMHHCFVDKCHSCTQPEVMICCALTFCERIGHQ